MKKFLCYTSLFTLIVLTVLAAFEWSLRRIPTLYTATHQALTERAPQLHTLIMGSSVAKDGINALLLDSTGRAYNMAMPGEQVTYGYLKFCHYAERMPQLRDVVWGLAFYNLFQDDRTDVDASKRAGHRIYMDIDTTDDWMDGVECLSTKSLALRKWTDYYIKGKDLIACDAYGLNIQMPKAQRRKAYLDNAAERAHGHNKEALDNHSLIVANARMIDSVATRCSARGIRLWLVLPPVSRPYAKACDASLLREAADTLSAIASRHKGVYAIDYMLDARFTDDDFFDRNHLTCDEGARKFTLLLRHDMRQHCPQALR